MSATSGYPPGPRGGRLADTVAFHRDPLGQLRAARARYGDVFTVRLATSGPIVVTAGPQARAQLPGSDPQHAHAGEARRRILPMASPRSVFGGDGEAHDQARARQADGFAAEHVRARVSAIAAIAEAHVARWPTGRPFRLLPRLRAIADEIFVREVLEVRESPRATQLARAIGGLLWTPGNPPLSIPGPQDGLMGRLIDREFRRRRARVAALLDTDSEAEVDELLSTLMAAQEPMAAALTWVALHRIADPGIEPLEALRCNPPALGVLRRLQTATEIDGHLLPAGAVTMVPIPLVQRDDGALLPFGDGARRCLGEHLAWAELDAVLPAVFAPGPLRAIPQRVEPMVLRGTILVPVRSGLVVRRPGR